MGTTVMRKMVEEVVVQSGLWDDGRRQSHGYLLTPEVLLLSRERLEELNLLAAALGECLEGVGQLLHDVHLGTGDVSCYSPHPFETLKEMVVARTPPVYRAMQSKRPRSIPVICHVDLLEDESGRLWIAEIDGINKRGFGYATLQRKVAEAVLPSGAFLPGIATTIASRMRLYPSQEPLLLLAPGRESYYRPWFTILKKALEACDVEVKIAYEREALRIVKARNTERESMSEMPILDWPLIDNVPLNNELGIGLIHGHFHFFLPPKPFFGSKMLLGLLRNDEWGGEEVEDVLLRYIPSATLALVREYIPRTYLVGDGSEWWAGRFGDPPWIRHSGLLLKRVLASGMKGVYFPEDPEYETAFKMAQRVPYSAILQEEVSNRVRQLRYFGDDGILREGGFQLRITAYFDLIDRKIADVDITACQDKHIHGRRDCLLFGAAVEA